MKSERKNGQVRIIAGQWRHSKLIFRGSRGLRPTPNAVRETLFNWLAADIVGAHCLDLFAGSGALGLEAASRGAHTVTLVENDRVAAECIKSNLVKLAASDINVVCQNARRYSANPASQQFDIIFLDPPYQSKLLSICARNLEANRWLRDNALIYVESPQLSKTHTIPANSRLQCLPQNWQLLRSNQQGEVNFELYRRTIPSVPF